MPLSTPSATPTATAAFSLNGLDACTLLDEGAVRALTGTSLKFSSDGSMGTCFWGVTTAGEPAYVEISAFRTSGLANWFRADAECTIVPVSVDAHEAAGQVCDKVRRPRAGSEWREHERACQ